ncbi:MAG: hypothetical protein ABI761_15265 [Saprospiraceae bacterium]
MNKLKDIFFSPRIAFQLGLISRSVGLLLFTIFIARRWNMSEIARFESFSIFQYVIFFSWFPAYCIVLLRQGRQGNVPLQKSFLFSVLCHALLLVILLCTTMILLKNYFLPWNELTINDYLQLLLMMVTYFLLQAFVYVFYIQGEIKKQWRLILLQLALWILVIIVAHSFNQFMLWSNIGSVVIIALVFPSLKIARLDFQKQFWNDVVNYTVSLSIGAATLIIASYYVQAQYGLQDELNWYRYGTRELPVIPALIAGFGQSFLIQNTNEKLFSLESMKKGLNKYLYALIVPLIILMVAAVPIFKFFYGPRFIPAASLMSIYLLIFIPRMIPSNTLMQYYNEQKALLWIAATELLFVVLGLFFFTKGGGLTRIVWILIAGTVLERLLQVIVLRQHHQIKISDFVPIKTYVIWSGLLVLAYLVQSSIVWNGVN